MDDGYGFGLGRRLADGLKRRTGFSLLFITLPAACSPAPLRAAVSLSVNTPPHDMCARPSRAKRLPVSSTPARFHIAHHHIASRSLSTSRTSSYCTLLNLVLSSTEMHHPFCPFLVSLLRFAFPDHGSPPSTFDPRFRPATAIRDPRLPVTHASLARTDPSPRLARPRSNTLSPRSSTTPL